MPATLIVLRWLAIVLFVATSASAEVVRVEIRRRDDFRTYVRLIGRVYFAVDPAAAANRGISDIDLAPRNARGLVEFSSDVLFFQPKVAGAARGTVFFEIVNRGRDQALGLLSAAVQQDLSPEHWELGDRFLLERGFTMAFLGWQFDVQPAQGLTFQTPAIGVTGRVRADYVETAEAGGASGFAVAYCAADPSEPGAALTVRARIDEPARVLPRASWQFGPNGCSVRSRTRLQPGLHEVVYEAKGSFTTKHTKDTKIVWGKPISASCSSCSSW